MSAANQSKSEAKPSGKWPKGLTLQRRLTRYAASGPNCPNGHAWKDHAKFNHRGYRFCGACTAEKAERRRNDPATYTGACPNGHPFTRENTMITCWNGKVCVTCMRKPEGKPRILRPGEMEAILLRARRGDTTNEIAGEGGPKHKGKGIISRVRLLGACMADTPEARELKALLKQNGEAAIGNGRPLYRWSPESLKILQAECEKRTRPDRIADLINVKFGRNFTVGAIYTKASKLGIIVPRMRERIRATKSPALTGIIAAPSHKIFTFIDGCLPRYLDFHKRKEIMSEMMLAVLEGRLALEDAPRRYREFLRAVDHMFPTKFALRSIDEPAFSSTGSRMPLIETISEGLWV